MSDVILDRRMWAVTLAKMWAQRAEPEQLNDVAVVAMRQVGPDGIIMGLTDLAAALMEGLAEHHGMTLDEVEWDIRHRAAEEGSPDA